MRTPYMNELMKQLPTPTSHVAEMTESDKLELKKQLLERQHTLLMEQDFRVFLREAWKIIDNTELCDNWYLDAIAENLQALREGKLPEATGNRLIINQPPRTAKSNITSILFPCWVWATDPKKQFIFSTYSFEKLSVPQSLTRRRLLQSDWYQQRWGGKFQLSDDENKTFRYSNTAGGVMMATSTGGTVTGLGADFIIIDDPHNVEQAESDVERTSAVRFCRTSLLTRFNMPATGKAVVVMQRLNAFDVTGSFLEDKNWTHLCLPAIAEQEEVIVLPISKRRLKRKEGSLLDPVRLTMKALDELRLGLDTGEGREGGLGSTAFAGQYQQRPAPKEGIIFNPAWMHTYDNRKPPSFEMIVITVDCAFKDLVGNDLVAIQCWGFVGARKYLINKDTQRRGYISTKMGIRAMREKYPLCRLVLIEDKANGPAVVDELSREFNVLPITPEGGKESRASGCSPDFEAGNVFLPQYDPDEVLVDKTTVKPNPWLGSYVDNLAKFPNDKHDDDVDATTQVLIWRAKNRCGLLEYYRELAKELPVPGQEGYTAPEEREKKTSFAKVERNDRTPSCETCGGVTWRITHTPGKEPERVCVTCIPKCSRCKGERIQDGVCARCGLQLPVASVRANVE